MYICLCRGYTEKKIEEACRDASTIKEVLDRLGGEPAQCNLCLPEILSRLEAAKKRRDSK